MRYISVDKETIMKFIISSVLAAFTMLSASPAFAQHGPYGRHFPQRQWHPHYGWVAPVVIGGVVGYALARPTVVQRNEVIVEEVVSPAPVVTVTPTVQCTAWKEIQGSDGKIYRERSCNQLPQ